MELKKTLLSKKIIPSSIFTGLVSYLVLVLVFIIDDERLVANGRLVYEKGLYWKAFTSALMHGDFMHLGNNTLFFFIFSVLLNSYFGFWIFPVLSFLVGGIINLIVLKFYPPGISIAGISGVIYFMAAFWMTLFVCLERQRSIGRRLIIVTGVSLVLLFPETFVKNVSYLAHALGFGMGIISGLVYFKTKRQELRSHELWVEKAPENQELEEYIQSLEKDQSISID